MTNTSTFSNTNFIVVVAVVVVLCLVPAYCISLLPELCLPELESSISSSPQPTKGVAMPSPVTYADWGTDDYKLGRPIEKLCSHLVLQGPVVELST